jgi:hypothetical protein
MMTGLQQLDDIIGVERLLDSAPSVFSAVLGQPRALLRLYAATGYHQPKSEAWLTPEQIEVAKRTAFRLREELWAEKRLLFVVRDFFDAQIDLMQRAIREYHVRGIEAFRTVSQEAAIALTIEGVELAQAVQQRDDGEGERVVNWQQKLLAGWKEIQATMNNVVLFTEFTSILLGATHVVFGPTSAPQAIPTSAVHDLLLPPGKPVPADATAVKGVDHQSGDDEAPNESQSGDPDSD